MPLKLKRNRQLHQPPQNVKFFMAEKEKDFKKYLKHAYRKIENH